MRAKPSGVIVMILTLVVGAIAASCRRPVQQSQSTSSTPIIQETVQEDSVVIKFEELSERSQETIKKLLRESIVSAANKGRASFLEAAKITDAIERSLIDDFDSLVQTHDADILYSIYVLKPNKEPERARVAEVTSRGKVVLRYTCVAADVSRPMALVSIIQIEDGHPLLREHVLSYTTNVGWKATSIPADRR